MTLSDVLTRLFSSVGLPVIGNASEHFDLSATTVAADAASEALGTQILQTVQMVVVSAIVSLVENGDDYLSTSATSIVRYHLTQLTMTLTGIHYYT